MTQLFEYEHQYLGLQNCRNDLQLSEESLQKDSCNSANNQK